MPSSDFPAYVGWIVSVLVAAVLVVPMWNWLGPRPTVAIAAGMGTFFLQLWIRRMRAGRGSDSGATPSTPALRGLSGSFNRRLVISLSAALFAWYLAGPLG